MDKLGIKNKSYKTNDLPEVFLSPRPEVEFDDAELVAKTVTRYRRVQYQIKGTSCPHTAFLPPRTPVWRSTSAGRFPSRPTRGQEYNWSVTEPHN